MLAGALELTKLIKFQTKAVAEGALGAKFFEQCFGLFESVGLYFLREKFPKTALHFCFGKQGGTPVEDERTNEVDVFFILRPDHQGTRADFGVRARCAIGFHLTVRPGGRRQSAKIIIAFHAAARERALSTSYFDVAVSASDSASINFSSSQIRSIVCRIWASVCKAVTQNRRRAFSSTTAG